MMLVRTKPVTRTSSGGMDIEEIIEWIIIERKRTELLRPEASTCGMDGQQDAFLLTVVDRRNKSAVGITWDGTFKKHFFNWRV